MNCLQDDEKSQKRGVNLCGMAKKMNSVIMHFNSFMEVNRMAKLQLAEKIDLFQPDKKEQTYNPEEFATCRLLEISNEEFDFESHESQQYLDLRMEKQKVNYVQKNTRATSPVKPTDARLSVTENFTKSHKMWRKSSVNCLTGQQVCVMKKERVLNLSNFLIIEHESPSNLNIYDSNVSPPQECESPKPNFKVRPPKNIMSFIRKRNINFIKEQAGNQKEEIKGSSPAKSPSKRTVSPTQRMNMSCELPRNQEEMVCPIKIITNNRLDNSNVIEFRCTSPNFRNKKLTNYLRYRMGNKNA